MMRMNAESSGTGRSCASPPEAYAPPYVRKFSISLPYSSLLSLVLHTWALNALLPARKHIGYRRPRSFLKLRGGTVPGGKNINSSAIIDPSLSIIEREKIHQICSLIDRNSTGFVQNTSLAQALGIKPMHKFDDGKNSSDRSAASKLDSWPPSSSSSAPFPLFNGSLGYAQFASFLVRTSEGTARGRCILGEMLHLLYQTVSGVGARQHFSWGWKHLSRSCAPVVPDDDPSSPLGENSGRAAAREMSLTTQRGQHICNLAETVLLRCPDSNGERRLHLSLKEEFPNTTTKGPLPHLNLTLFTHPNIAKREFAPFKVAHGIFKDETEIIRELTMQHNGSHHKRGPLEVIGSVWRMKGNRTMRLLFSRIDVGFRGLRQKRYTRWEDLQKDATVIQRVQEDAAFMGALKRKKPLAQVWTGDGRYPSVFKRRGYGLTEKDLSTRYTEIREKLLQHMATERGKNPNRGVRLSTLREAAPKGRFFIQFGVQKFVDFVKAVPEIQVAPNLKCWLRTESPNRTMPHWVENALTKRQYKYAYYRDFKHNKTGQAPYRPKRPHFSREIGFKGRMRVNEIRSSRLFSERVLNNTEENIMRRHAENRQRVLATFNKPYREGANPTS